MNKILENKEYKLIKSPIWHKDLYSSYIVATITIMGVFGIQQLDKLYVWVERASGCVSRKFINIDACKKEFENYYKLKILSVLDEKEINKII